MASASFVDLVRKRYAGDGWIVISELRDHIDVGRSRGRADAVAFGLWASNKYEAHGFEFKETRADLKAELLDPSKCEYVGRYCAFWWLVVRDEKLIEDLVIPAAWGILAPITRGGRPELKTIRKATRRAPAPMTPGFVACLIRTGLSTFRPVAEVRELQQRIDDLQADQRESADAVALRELRVEHTKLERDSRYFELGVERLCQHLGIDRDDMSTWGPETLAKQIKFAQFWLQSANPVAHLEALLSASANLARVAGATAALADGIRTELGIRGVDGEHHTQCPAFNRDGWRRVVCICGISPVEAK